MIAIVCAGTGGLASPVERPGPDEWLDRDQIKLLFAGEPLAWSEIKSTLHIEAIGPGAYAQSAPAEAHEIDSVRQIGRALYERRGLSVVLISRFNTTLTPTFDGVVIDEAGQIVANFSLKRKVGFGGKWHQTVIDHLGQVMAWSARPRWVESAIKMTGSPKRRAGGRVLTYRFQSVEIQKRLSAYLYFYRVFVPPTARPAWLLIDFAVERAYPPHLTSVFERISSERPRVKLVTHRNGALRTFLDGRELTDCGGELSPEERSSR